MLLSALFEPRDIKNRAARKEKPRERNSTLHRYGQNRPFSAEGLGPMAKQIMRACSQLKCDQKVTKALEMVPSSHWLSTYPAALGLVHIW